MKSTALYTITILSLLIASSQLFAADLRIIIEPPESREGKLYISLNHGEFHPREEYIYAQQIRADYNNQGEAVELVFAGLKPGQYAVRIYQDINNNGEFDTNLLGIPKEPYGTSNNATGTFGPPSFEDAAITIEDDDVINRITLNN